MLLGPQNFQIPVRANYKKCLHKGSVAYIVSGNMLSLGGINSPSKVGLRRIGSDHEGRTELASWNPAGDHGPI